MYERCRGLTLRGVKRMTEVDVELGERFNLRLSDGREIEVVAVCIDQHRNLRVGLIADRSVTIDRMEIHQRNKRRGKRYLRRVIF